MQKNGETSRVSRSRQKESGKSSDIRALVSSSPVSSRTRATRKSLVSETVKLAVENARAASADALHSNFRNSSKQSVATQHSHFVPPTQKQSKIEITTLSQFKPSGNLLAANFKNKLNLTLKNQREIRDMPESVINSILNKQQTMQIDGLSSHDFSNETPVIHGKGKIEDF